jgi:hypothetical protein
MYSCDSIWKRHAEIKLKRRAASRRMGASELSTPNVKGLFVKRHLSKGKPFDISLY